MNKAELAQKQKRLQTWSEFLENEVTDKALKQAIQGPLDSYKALIRACWDSPEITETEISRFRDLERQLVQLNERARVTITPKGISSNSKRGLESDTHG